MPVTTTINKKPAEAMTPGGLILALTTLSPPPGKDEDHGVVHAHGAHVHL